MLYDWELSFIITVRIVPLSISEWFSIKWYSIRSRNIHYKFINTKIFYFEFRRWWMNLMSAKSIRKWIPFEFHSDTCLLPFNWDLADDEVRITLTKRDILRTSLDMSTMTIISRCRNRGGLISVELNCLYHCSRFDITAHNPTCTFT